MSSYSYVYPGNKDDFYNEFGGDLQKGPGLANGIIIVIIIIVVIFIILGIAFLLTTSTVTSIPHAAQVNLNSLKDLNNPDVECCVFAGTTAPNESYVYDSTANITYSLQVPTSINTVCSSCPNPTLCISQNTDSTGKIIPVADFHANPYYTFECDLFNDCSSTAAC
jgi:PKD repeat protein